MNIRKGTPEDLPKVRKVYDYAIEFMGSTGNPNQWKKGHPPKEVLEKDIENGNFYVCTENGSIAGCFSFIIGDDPTYAVIEDGHWHHALTYGTIHRLAGNGQVKGIFKAVLDFCSGMISYIRVDTHADNKVMQSCFRKNGFEECGIIHVANGTPRIAFDRLTESHSHHGMPADEAVLKLKEGNAVYMKACQNPGDISPAIRQKTAVEGQFPYAVILCCSDSREIPEAIFSAGIGELFVIRVAGNVIDEHQLGSIEYAADHLGCRLVVVLGHTHCGAVDAAIHHDPDGHIKYITDEIKLAIGDETDPYKASCLNVKRSVKLIEENTDMRILEQNGVRILGAIYDIEDGSVTFIE